VFSALFYIALFVLYLVPSISGFLQETVPIWILIVASLTVFVATEAVNLLVKKRSPQPEGTSPGRAFVPASAYGSYWTEHEGVLWKGNLSLWSRGKIALDQVDGPFCPACRTMMVPKEKGLVELLNPPFKWVCSNSKCRKMVFTQENLPLLRTEVTNVISAQIDAGTVNQASKEIKWQ
jgi:hypothetical protein